jgi:hypothetical protein
VKWLLFFVVAIAVVILAVTLIGLALPKAHHATRMARFAQPPQALFALIAGPQDWRPGVTTEPLRPDQGRRRWRERVSHRWITFEEAQSDPPRLYQTRIAGENLPFSGTWTWQITAAPDGCICRITEDGQVYNPIFRFMSRFIIGQTKTIDDYLNAMGKKFGQPVQLQD